MLVWIKDKIRGRYLGRHMYHLADSIAKLSQGRENWYIGREGIPVDDSSGGKCEPVIVIECMDLECMDLSIGQRVNVSRLSCVSNKVLKCWDSYKVICDLIHHQKSTVYAALGSEGRQFRSFNIAVTLEVYL